MKSLAIELGAYNAILWRCAISLCISGVLFMGLRLALPRKAALRIHIWRGVVISVMAFLFFWGLKTVPLAEAIALSFIAPLITLYLAAGMLHEEIGRRAIMASLLGFAGAVVIVAGQLDGGFNSDIGPGLLAILTSALLYAYNLILQRRQALLAQPIEIALFQNATVVGVYLCLAPWLAVLPQLTDLPLLGTAAILSIASVLLISWAYARAQAKILVPVEYTAFGWAAIFGWLFFAEAVTLATGIGAALIVIGCLLALGESEVVVAHTETTTA